MNHHSEVWQFSYRPWAEALKWHREGEGPNYTQTSTVHQGTRYMSREAIFKVYVSSRSSHPSWHHTIRIEQTHLSSFQIPLAHQAQNIMFQNTKFQATKFKPLRENSVLSSIALKSSITIQKIIGLYFLSLSFLKMQLCCSLFYMMFLRSLMAA